MRKKMQNILNTLKRHKYFLLFVLVFSYVQSIQVRLGAWNVFNAYIFTPEAAMANFFSAGILFFIMRLWLLRWQKANTFNWGEILKIFGASLLLYMVVINTLALIIALIFDTFERNFNPTTLLHDTFSDFINAFVYGSFFLSYFYYRKNQKNQQQMAAHNQALAETRINQLKTQLNPHFLFNNLNVLDQLIEEDQYKASDFLNEFADIYRYVLQVSDKKIIPLTEEIAFAQKYFTLIQHKYAKAYTLDVQAPQARGSIIPMSLQLLLENAVQHNLGTTRNPVRITISIDSHIRVSNNTLPKRHAKSTSGRALVNLKEQYRLLTGQNIDIQQTREDFTVIIPIISTPETC